MSEKKDNRTRNWAFIQYDDSSPENWRDILDSLKIPWVESPLHDCDLNPDGEKKKSHRHIILAFNGKKSFEQVQEISNKISGCKVEKVQNMRGYVRYLTHMDNPEKHQYNSADVICHCGFETEIYLKLSTTDIRKALKDIFRFIKTHDFQSYSDFVDYLIENDMDDWLEIVTMKHTVSVKEYIKSYSYKHLETNPETGETYYVGDFLNKRKG